MPALGRLRFPSITTSDRFLCFFVLACLLARLR